MFVDVINMLKSIEHCQIRRIGDKICFIDPYESYYNKDSSLLFFSVKNNSSFISDAEIKKRLLSDKGVSCISFIRENKYDKNDIYSLVFDKPHPWKVGFELTSKCNFSCPHCYASSLMDDDTDTDKILSVIDELKKAGVLWIWFTGGECTYRSDFIEIYEYAKRQGFIICFLTNGSLVTDDLINVLIKYPPYVVKISLYGLSSDSYEAMTGCGENYNKVIAGIDKLISNNINVAVQCVVTKLNDFEIGKMEEYCDSLGVSYNTSYKMIPKLNGNIGPKKLSTNLSHINARNIEEYANFYCNSIDETKLFRNKSISDGEFFCGAGYCFCFISSDLICAPCLLGRDIGVRLGEEVEFADAFYSVSEKRKEFLKISDECKICESVCICDICDFRKKLHRNCDGELLKLCFDNKQVYKLTTQMKGGLL